MDLQVMHADRKMPRDIQPSNLVEPPGWKMADPIPNAGPHTGTKYANYRRAGWTDELLIKHGYLVRI